MGLPFRLCLESDGTHMNGMNEVIEEDMGFNMMKGLSCYYNKNLNNDQWNALFSMSQCRKHDFPFTQKLEK